MFGNNVKRKSKVVAAHAVQAYCGVNVWHCTYLISAIN